jgi:hypothetical protein
MLSCYKLTNNVSTCEGVWEVADMVGNVLTLPTIGMLMRLSPLISLID